MVSMFPYFSEFPDDVQRLVFELAFEGYEMPSPYKNGYAVHLALVSKRVSEWIEPLIYRNLSTSKIRGNPVRDASRKPDNFFKKHVRSLCVDEIPETEFIEDIFSECHTNLVGLAWWPVTHNRGKWASLLLTQSFPSLRKLSIYFGIFPSDLEARFTEPIFQNLTHLDIGIPATAAHFRPSPEPNFDNLKKITLCKNLQFLASLIHLHLDMSRAVTFRGTGTIENFKDMVLGVLSILPLNAKYFSIRLPHAFLEGIADLPVVSRQIYHDLILGGIDSRVLICYCPSMDYCSSSRKHVPTFLSVKGFSEYLFPCDRGQTDKSFRVVVPRLVNDFWEEAERLVRKRNKELYGGGTWK